MKCHFDQGDCCGDNVDTIYCTKCICFESLNCSAPLDLIGNGVCNDEANNVECNFDGGDCCGHCETVTIALDNNAKVAQGSREGIYHNSSMVNGKPSWTSTNQAIWYDQQFDNWIVGPLNNIGSSTAGIISDDASQCPFNLLSEMWIFWDGNSWTRAGLNDINVDCQDDLE